MSRTVARDVMRTAYLIRAPPACGSPVRPLRDTETQALGSPVARRH